MRLINIEDESLLKTVSVGGLSAKALWRLIKRQRTVDAIHVKWLRQWFAENGFKFYDDNDDIHLVCDIEEMLLDWEKENEVG